MPQQQQQQQQQPPQTRTMADEPRNPVCCSFCPCPRFLQIKSPLIRACLAEILGTFTLMLFGCASVAQVRVSDGGTGNMVTITISWGLAVTMGVYISGRVSGGHLNPAVTLALATVNMHPWLYVIPYMISQFIGSFLGSLTTYLIYSESIMKKDIYTAGIFATFPQPYISNVTAFFDQIVGTAMLLICVMAIIDKRNMNVPQGIVPIAVGLVVVLIGMCFAHNCGYSINPARDLSPRMMIFAMGWDAEVFWYKGYYFWIPFLVPFLGALLGVWIYIIFIQMHWPPEEPELSLTNVLSESEMNKTRDID